MNSLVVIISLIVGYFMISDKSFETQVKKLEPIHYIGILIVAVFLCNMEKKEGWEVINQSDAPDGNKFFAFTIVVNNTDTTDTTGSVKEFSVSSLETVEFKFKYKVDSTSWKRISGIADISDNLVGDTPSLSPRNIMNELVNNDDAQSNLRFKLSVYNDPLPPRPEGEPTSERLAQEEEALNDPVNWENIGNIDTSLFDDDNITCTTLVQREGEEEAKEVCNYSIINPAERDKILEFTKDLTSDIQALIPTENTDKRFRVEYGCLGVVEQGGAGYCINAEEGSPGYLNRQDIAGTGFWTPVADEGINLFINSENELRQVGETAIDQLDAATVARTKNLLSTSHFLVDWMIAVDDKVGTITRHITESADVSAAAGEGSVPSDNLVLISVEWEGELSDEAVVHTLRGEQQTLSGKQWTLTAPACHELPYSHLGGAAGRCTSIMKHDEYGTYIDRPGEICSFTWIVPAGALGEGTSERKGLATCSGGSAVEGESGRGPRMGLIRDQYNPAAGGTHALQPCSDYIPQSIVENSCNYPPENRIDFIINLETDWWKIVVPIVLFFLLLGGGGLYVWRRRRRAPSESSFNLETDWWRIVAPIVLFFLLLGGLYVRRWMRAP